MDPDQSHATYIRHLGHGARKLLALHCTIAFSGAWSGLAQALNETASLTAPDMLSHGRSPDWDGQGDFFDLVSDRSRAVLSEPMDVIGHSFGAMIALRLAVEHPDLVRSLVLIEPVFFAIAKQDAPALFDQHERDHQPVSQAFEAGDKALAARLFNRMWSTQDGPGWADLTDRTRAAMIRGIQAVPAVHPALYDDRAGLLKPGVMAGMTAPTLLLSGSETHPVMPAICDGLNRRLPNARHQTVEGAGHMLPISHPQETAAKLQSFWHSAASSAITTG